MAERRSPPIKPRSFLMSDNSRLISGHVHLASPLSYWQPITTPESQRVGIVKPYLPTEPRKLEIKDIAPIKHQRTDWHSSNNERPN